MRKNTARICLGLCLLLVTSSMVTIRSHVSEVLASEPFSTYRPVVFVTPDVIEQDVGVDFTVSVKIFNLTDAIWTDPVTQIPYNLGNLYGVGLNLTWDPTVLDYVNHFVKIPVDDYPDGVLNYPTTAWEDNLNIAAGWYKMAYSSTNPAPAFNNPGANSTVFEITFQAKKKGSSNLLLAKADLAGRFPGDRVYHEGYATNTGRGAVFTTPGVPVAEFNVWPPDLRAGVNKPVRFNASESYDTDGTITDYIWDFGDGGTGTGQIINHTYTSTGQPKVTLKVRDNEGVESRPATKTLSIIEIRDVAIRDIGLRQLIKYGTEAEINVTVSNKAGIGSPESFIVSTYYNSTPIDDWVLIDTRSVVNLTGDFVLVFSWNTSDTLIPPGGASYFYRILANATYVPHEANTTDNSMVTAPVEITAEDIHDVSATISSLSVEASGGQSFNSPFILGENVTVRFNVRASGTTDETYNITLRVIARNGTELMSPKKWSNEFLEYGNAKPYSFSTANLPATYCNFTLTVDTAQVDKNLEDNHLSLEVRVVRPPAIDIDYPQTIYMGESAAFDATASRHQDPDAQITAYAWSIRTEGEAVFSVFKQGATVGYIFNTTGTWIIRLRITDDFGLTFDDSQNRPEARAYRMELTINVQQRPGGGSQFPIDPLYLVAGIIIVVIVAIIAYRMIRKPKLPQ